MNKGAIDPADGARFLQRCALAVSIDQAIDA